jgi:arylsulfatase A-like enzyme
LLPFLHGQAPATWRPFAISEYDYAMRPAAPKLGVAPRDARLFMVADKRWKYIHAIGFRPMLFDTARDPDELRDLGSDPAHAGECARLSAALSQWGLRLSQRATRSDRQIAEGRGKSMRRGILIGVWDEADIPAEYWSGYLGERS